MIESALAFADLARRESLRQVVRIGALQRLFVHRDRRIAISFLLSLSVATGFGLVAPLYSLWLGAALLGVPHVLSGLRHLARDVTVRPLTKGCALAGIALGAAQLAGAGDWTVQVFAGLFAASAIAEVLAARAGFLRTALLLSAVGVGAAFGAARPWLFIAVMTHVHALTSLGYFALRAHRKGVRVWPLLLAFAAVALAALTGLLDPLMPKVFYAPAGVGGSVVLEARQALFPEPSAIALRRGLFLYVLGQQLHFAVWLRLIPDVERARPVPPPFLRAWAQLKSELGRLAAPVVVLGAVSVPLLLLGAGPAREAYFALTYFHLGLEAAVVAGQLARAPLGAVLREPAAAVAAREVAR